MVYARLFFFKVFLNNASTFFGFFSKHGMTCSIYKNHFSMIEIFHMALLKIFSDEPPL